MSFQHLFQRSNVQPKLVWWRCQRSHKGPWETQHNLLGFHIHHHVINRCPDKSQILNILRKSHNKLMYQGLKSISRDTCVTKCHLEVDWTTQRLPIKSHAVFIGDVSGLHPPQRPFPLPTNPTNPDPVIYDWGPLPQITAFEKNPSMDEKETWPPDCSRGKCHSSQLACIPQKK